VLMQSSQSICQLDEPDAAPPFDLQEEAVLAASVTPTAQHREISQGQISQGRFRLQGLTRCRATRLAGV
jgi:hypothetical protein